MKIADWIRHLEQVAGIPDLPRIPPDPTLLSGARGEQILWRAATGDAAADPEPVLSRSPTGPLLAPDAFLAIEVWAECELASLHALHRLARLGQGPLADAWRARLGRATSWHLEHTQPDNSTNRPWALHVFLLEGARNPDASLYAETLLGNMLATDARSEALSRWILADAAAELRLAT
ncbi:MAG: hypothetical protein ACKO0W_08460 [Planctomycetota bacterium]